MTAGSETAALTFDAALSDVPDVIGMESATTMQPEASPPAIQSLSHEVLGELLGLPFALYATTIKTGGEFWPLNEQEKKVLATVWHPIIAPLLARHPELDMLWVSALMMTSGVVTPRLARETARRASLTASTETEKSGDSSSLPDPPAVESLRRPTA